MGWDVYGVSRGSSWGVWGRCMVGGVLAGVAGGVFSGVWPGEGVQEGVSEGCVQGRCGVRAVAREV